MQMFHPLVFDNIKVVLEGAVYDRDFDGDILVTARADLIDTAVYQRLFQIDFRLPEGAAAGKREVTAQFQLRTSLADIAGELMEQPLTEHIGCTVCIHFYTYVQDVERDTNEIVRILNEIWGDRPHITQQISATLDEHRPFRWPPDIYENKITLDFHRKIDEGNIGDLRDLIDHTVVSLARLSE
nr:hypothetical protein [Brevibacillus massiliensis]